MTAREILAALRGTDARKPAQTSTSPVDPGSAMTDRIAAVARSAGLRVGPPLPAGETGSAPARPVVVIRTPDDRAERLVVATHAGELELVAEAIGALVAGAETARRGATLVIAADRASLAASVALPAEEQGATHAGPRHAGAQEPGATHAGAEDVNAEGARAEDAGAADANSGGARSDEAGAEDTGAREEVRRAKSFAMLEASVPELPGTNPYFPVLDHERVLVRAVRALEALHLSQPAGPRLVVSAIEGGSRHPDLPAGMKARARFVAHVAPGTVPQALAEHARRVVGELPVKLAVRPLEPAEMGALLHGYLQGDNE